MEREQTLKDELLADHDEFRSLYEEHQGYEDRLSELYQRSLPSEDDELEEKRIKRRKLFLKDRMEAILRAHRENRVTA